MKLSMPLESALETEKTEIMDENENMKNRIAIVGMDCRLPGANNISEFWKNLVEEKESLIEFTNEQLEEAGISPNTYKKPNYVRRRGIVENPDLFDAEFFNFTPREAELLDPQHRIFLECAWHALEDAGVNPYSTDKKIAVFGGTGSPYQLVDTINNPNVLKYANGTSIITSNDKDYVTTRVSYKLNLNGPSVDIQCACSTSMVGVVMGIDNLLNYQSDLVLAGGATIELPATKGYLYQTGGLESPDGRCRTFDKDAGGTVFSRGCGVLALKRLEDALAENDHIYAVILGGSINNDGDRKAGFTAPSVQGQVEVITEAIEMAGVDARTISMVEAHGTATTVGDPIEITSLTETFSQYTQDKQFCAVGSVKTNIGHTDVASGAASLIKAALSLKYGMIPASLNFKESNPAINFPKGPFYVNTKTSPWETNGQPRRAIVNSFGVGGTNACVVLEEPPLRPDSKEEQNADLLFISAHHKNSFSAYCENISRFIEENPELNLKALAHTSRTARKPMKHKGIFAFRDRDDLLAQLAKPSPIRKQTNSTAGLVWMFPGQGNQFINMGKGLYEHEPLFRETVDYCAAVLKPMLNLDIREVIYPAELKKEEATEKIRQTNITQPAIFIISYATARLLISAGSAPDKLVGHSVGEYVAAALSGIMSLEDALKSVAYRGKLVYDLPEGSMLAVLMPEEEVRKILPESLNIAVINSPELVVVSGSDEAIEGFAATLKQKHIFNKVLETSHAFHSAMMEPCLAPYREFFSQIKLNQPSIPVVSTVSGLEMTDEQALDHEYWVQHVVHPVRFGDAVTHILESESEVFLECGPGQSLESAVKRRLKADDPYTVFGTLNENQDALKSFHSALGKLWIEEKSVDFSEYFHSSGITKIPFPLLPYNRKSFRIELATNEKSLFSENVKKENISDWYYMPSWIKTAPIDLVPSNKTNHADMPEAWIVFTSNSLTENIINDLRQKGKQCYAVKQADEFSQGNDNFGIRPETAGDYHEMLNAILGDVETKLRIIHGWNFSEKEEQEISLQNAGEILDKGFYSLLYLEQALIGLNLTENISITGLIDNGFNITGNNRVKPEKSLAVGPMRVLFKEHPKMSTRLINIETPLKENYSDYLTQAIEKEAVIETDETIVSYAGNARWAEGFEPVNLMGKEDGLPSLLKEGGVYLITGGSGGIGRTLSTVIASQVKTTIIWTGREALPDRKEWDGILADENWDMRQIEKIRTIKEIENSGSSIRYFQAGADDLKAMQEVVLQTEKEFGRINGIVHSAGTPGGGVVALQQKSETDKVLIPKIYGTLVLKELFKDKNPDFIYFYSSITSLLGEAGRVDYISANAFMDAMAKGNCFNGQNNTVSVNWGQWGIIGMAADWQRKKDQRKKAKANDKPVVARAECNPIHIRMIQQDNGTEKYEVDVNPNDYWVTGEHFVSGMPALVGTAYLDVLRQWQEIKDPTARLTVKEAQFISPLIIFSKVPRKLVLHIESRDNNQFGFVFISSTLNSSKGDSAPKEHFKGMLKIEKSDEPEITDLKTLEEQINGKPSTTPHFLVILDLNQKPLLQYSNRWNCKKSILSGEQKWLTRLELPAEFADDLSFYPYHPALLDVATSAHFMHLPKYLGSFLPYAYGSMTFYRPFERKIICYASHSKPYQDDKLYYDFSIYNLRGQLLMQIEDYAFIKVGEASSYSTSNTTSIKSQKPVFEDDDILPDEGKEVLDTLLHQAHLGQIVVYTKDLKLDFIESKISYQRKKLNEKIGKKENAVEKDDRPEIDTPYEAPDNEIEKSILAVWSSILGISKIGVNDTFNELGGNSLLSIQVISGVGDEFGIDIRANEFAGNSTIRGLAELILTKILEEHSSAEIEELLKED